MPVLSPHRSTAASSGLSGSYRSTFSTSLDHHRPYSTAGSSYVGGSSYVPPRISSYSERYTSRSYSDANGRTYFSRAGSITEDGYTTRFREEGSREGSVRRESLLDSPIRRSISSTGTSGDLTSSSSRGSSLTSTLSVVDSIADLRNKYSASNYVPTVLRNREASRSRTTGDIGLPPIGLSDDAGGKLKVNEACEANNLRNLNIPVAINNTNNVVAGTAAIDAGTDVDNMRQHEDDNGNRPTVLEMTKKFEKRCAVSNAHTSTAPAPSKSVAVNTTSSSMTRRHHSRAAPVTSTSTSTNLKNDAALTVVSLSPKSKSHVTNTIPTTTTSFSTLGGTVTVTVTSTATTRHNHTNDFASYIPVEAGGSPVAAANADLAGAGGEHPRPIKQQQTPPQQQQTPVAVENGDMDRYHAANGSTGQKSKKANKDVNSTSPRLNRSPNGTASSGGALGGSSSNRSSLERDGSHPRQMGGSYEASSSAPAHHLSYDRSSPTKQMGLNGLKNIGNTCFMNSVIQCLSNTKPLLEYVKKDGYANDINTTLSSMKGALIKAFAQVIKELWSEDCSDRVVNTVALKSQIQRFAPRFMGYSQQDAQEFLRYLLEGLHEDVNRVTSKPTPIHTEIDEKLSDNDKAAESWQRYLRRENSKIVDLFVGQFKSTLRCTHCGHCSVTFDPFWDLSLPIPQKTGAIRLSQCLDSFTREETLDGDEKPTCSKCKERRKCTKSFTVHKFPKILVIHLKRFSPTERFRGKLSVTVDFPLEGLDMCGYASESNIQCRYNLYAVSNHSGTTYNGHYTAYCRHPYSASWHEYNDSRVSSISSKSIVSGEAYVLFYELDSKYSAHL